MFKIFTIEFYHSFFCIHIHCFGFWCANEESNCASSPLYFICLFLLLSKRQTKARLSGKSRSWRIVALIIIIIIIIAFKGAIRNFLQSLHSAANCLNMNAQVARAQLCANHVQHIKRLSRAIVMLRATWYEGTAQLLSLSWNRIYLSFISLAEPLNQWRRGGNRRTHRKPLAMSFRKCHILQPKGSSPKRDSNSHSNIGGRLGKQTC